MKCKYCGEEIDNDSLFCEQCGAKVNDESPVVKKGKRKSNTKKYIGYAVCIIIVVILIGVIATLIDNLGGRSALEDISEPTVDTLVASVEKSDLEREQLKSQGWVDLGLPSGTLWKNVNEEGYYSYDEAVKLFEGYIPTKSQWEELINYCQWTWSGWKANNDDEGYIITGHNGVSVFLPNMGYKVASKKYDRYGYGQGGMYWSSTLATLGKPYAFYTYRTYIEDDHQSEEDQIGTNEYDGVSNALSVRLAY